jgi:hypothetical protein
VALFNDDGGGIGFDNLRSDMLGVPGSPRVIPGPATSVLVVAGLALAWVLSKPSRGAVAAASAAASVRGWHITSRGWGPWTERPLPEVVRVAYPL